MNCENCYVFVKKKNTSFRSESKIYGGGIKNCPCPRVQNIQACHCICVVYHHYYYYQKLTYIYVYTPI